MREIIDSATKLRKHKIRVKDITDAEERRGRVRRGRGGPPHHPPHRQGQAPRQEEARSSARERKHRQGPRARSRSTPRSHETTSRSWSTTLEEMRLNKKTIDKIVQKLKSLIAQGRARRGRRTSSSAGPASTKGRASASSDRSAATAARATPRHEARLNATATGALEAPQRSEAHAEGASKKVEEELKLDVDERPARTVRGDPRRRAHGRAGEGRARRGEPPPRRLDREEVHEPRPAVPRPDPGGQHRPHEGRRQVRVQARLQVLDVRDVVDPAGDHARDRRPGADDPHPGPHDRDDQQAHPHLALPRAGVRPRADAGRDRREDGAAARQGPQGPEDREGADQPRDADRRGGRLAPRRLHRGQERRLARPRRSST